MLSKWPSEGPIHATLGLAPASPHLMSTKMLAFTSDTALTLTRDTFLIHSSAVCKAHQRDKLERLFRYVSRGALHLFVEPLDLIARFASLVPGSRTHLVRCFSMTRWHWPPSLFLHDQKADQRQ